MGLMDNIKKAQEMAQQAQQQGGGAAAQMPDGPVPARSAQAEGI